MIFPSVRTRVEESRLSSSFPSFNLGEYGAPDITRNLPASVSYVLWGRSLPQIQLCHVSKQQHLLNCIFNWYRHSRSSPRERKINYFKQIKVSFIRRKFLFIATSYREEKRKEKKGWLVQMWFVRLLPGLIKIADSVQDSARLKPKLSYGNTRFKEC